VKDVGRLNGGVNDAALDVRARTSKQTRFSPSSKSWPMATAAISWRSSTSTRRGGQLGRAAHLPHAGCYTDLARKMRSTSRSRMRGVNADLQWTRWVMGFCQVS
jgi:hypothetical protein